MHFNTIYYPNTSSTFNTCHYVCQYLWKTSCWKTFCIVAPIMCATNDTGYRRLCLECCCVRRDWTTTEWNQVVFSDEWRSNLGSDDNHVFVRNHRSERFNPGFGLQRHTAITPAVIVWTAITHDTRWPLTFIDSTLTAQRSFWYMLEPHVLPHLAGLIAGFFQ